MLLICQEKIILLALLALFCCFKSSESFHLITQFIMIISQLVNQPFNKSFNSNNNLWETFESFFGNQMSRFKQIVQLMAVSVKKVKQNHESVIIFIISSSYSNCCKA